MGRGEHILLFSLFMMENSLNIPPDILPLNHFSLFFSFFFFTVAQTQAYHNVPVTPPAERTVPGVAVLLGAVGIGMCGYSSRQLALHHRPSARVLQLVGTHTDAQRTPFLDAARRAGAYQEIAPPSFVGPKFP